MEYNTATVLMLIASTLVFYMLFLRKKTSHPLPPSLKPVPLIGHLLSLPSADEHIVYRDISSQLNSNIISFSVLGQTIVVLNSASSATDLLVRRSLIYSDRAELPMLNDERLVGWGKNTGFLCYGERWKNQRRMSQTALDPATSEDIFSKMINYTRLSVQRLLHSPESTVSEFRWMTAAILLSCLYGYDASHPFDELVYLVETAVDKVCEAASTSNFYVNTIPWLKYVPSWLPGAGWKRQANAWRVEKDKLQNDPFEWTKLRMAAGTATPSVVKSLLTQVVNGQFTEQRAEEEEDMIKWAAGTLYAAGAETTIASLTTLVLAMVLYPEVQKKIQVELDSVLGEDRLPELSDRESLPYLNCTIKEALRWGSPLPLALPHVCTEEDIYKEYRIPKGAIVMGNIWAISHDASVYPEPQIFNPDRFLDPSTPSPLTFGFGRRICPGSHFAESGMFIAIATLLAIFNITSSPGKSAPEAKTCMNRLVLHPAQFNCTVIPRSEKHKRLLEEWVEA